MIRRNDTIEIERAREIAVANQISIPAEQPVVRRPRSLTTLRLEVVAERARKMKNLKEALANGSYKVESEKVAKALLEVFNEDDLK